MDLLTYQSINTSSNITYQDAYIKVINTFPIYYKIFNKYYSEGKDVSYELNRIYQPIFTGLIDYYDKFMTEGIYDIILDIEKKFNPDKQYAIIDYLEYLFGNILYETFLFEIKKINPDNMKYEYLCIFEYIIRVEIVKYNQYFKIIENLKMNEPESKLLLAMQHRIEFCVKKISFCISWLKRNYLHQIITIDSCNQIISANDLELKINIDSVDTINSFMELVSNK
jgi:hypothetical protein